MPAIRVLLLNEKASVKKRIKALEELKAEFQRLAILFNEMTSHIDDRIKELKSSWVKDYG